MMTPDKFRKMMTIVCFGGAVFLIGPYLGIAPLSRKNHDHTPVSTPPEPTVRAARATPRATSTPTPKPKGKPAISGIDDLLR